MKTFATKDISIEFQLRGGTFSNGRNTKTIQGLGVSVRIEKGGFPDKGKANISVYNMSLSDMEELTALSFRPLFYNRNRVLIFAGEDGSLSQIYEGEIVFATADFNSAPEVSFNVEAMTGYFGSLTPSAPMAIKGSTSVKEVVKNFADQLGFNFKSENVETSLKDTVLNGSPLEKAQNAAMQAGAQLILDDNTMSLVNRGKPFSGNAVEINDGTGMIGYPTFGNLGVSVRTYFNPNIKFNGMINVVSIVPKASGQWRVIKLTHTLSAYLPSNSIWQTEVETIGLGQI